MTCLKFSDFNHITIFVPFVVQQEMDHLKNHKIKRKEAYYSRRATRCLLDFCKNTSANSNRLRYENERPGIISNSSNDEKILQICSKLKHQNLAKIYLFTSDQNMQLKSLQRKDAIPIFQQTTDFNKLKTFNGKFETTIFLKRYSIFHFYSRIL